MTLGVLHARMIRDLNRPLADWGEPATYHPTGRPLSWQVRVVVDESAEARTEAPPGQQVVRMGTILIPVADIPGHVPCHGDRIAIAAGNPSASDWTVQTIIGRDAAAWLVAARVGRPGIPAAPGRVQIPS
jgi:hypothetical protein